MSARRAAGAPLPLPPRPTRPPRDEMRTVVGLDGQEYTRRVPLRPCKARALMLTNLLGHLIASGSAYPCDVRGGDYIHSMCYANKYRGVGTHTFGEVAVGLVSLGGMLWEPLDVVRLYAAARFATEVWASLCAQLDALLAALDTPEGRRALSVPRTRAAGWRPLNVELGLAPPLGGAGGPPAPEA